MAIYSHNETTSVPSLSWLEIDVTIQSIGATEVVLLNSDGTLTVLSGSEFSGTTGPSGTLTSGTITGVARTDSTRTITYEAITGFSYQATAFSARLPEGNMQGMMADILSGNDTLNGFSGDDTLRGFAGNDTISGGTGLNGLIGNAGNDTLIGGTRGNNALDVNVANYAGATGAIVATLGSTSSVTGNASVGTDTLINVERVRGTAFDDTFTANSGFTAQYGALNLFEGMGGNDTITGNGVTRVFFSQAEDAVTVDLEAGTARSSVGDLAGVGIDTITGGVNGIHGSAFGDTLLGSNAATAELFRGLAGNDQIDGRGGGTDLADYVGSPNAVNVDLQAGTALDGFGTVDGLLNIEAVRGSELNDTLGGDDLDNILVGQGGNDVISGRGGNDFITGDDGRGAIFDFELGTNTPFDLGNDTIDGGAGTDTAGYFNPLTTADVVADPANNRWLVSTPSQGTDTLTNVEIVKHGAGRFLLVGASGFATVAEAAAAATQPGDVILTTGEDEPASVDLSASSQSLSIVTGAGSDQISLGSGDDTIDAGGGDDTVTSGAGNDVVRSGAGNDTIIGGVGTGDDVYDAGEDTDTVVYSSAVSSITVDLRATDRSAESATNFATIGDLLAEGGYTATTPVGKAQGADVGTDALIGVENIVGGQGADRLTGNADANHVAGGAGDDVIDGDGGDDTLVLSGNKEDYSLTGTALDFVIADAVAGRDGSDSVRNVEFIRFANATVRVADLLNGLPAIISNGGGDTATASTAENTTLVTTLAATDPDPGQPLTFSIHGGADAALFEIRNGNQLHFKAAPNFEAPTDAGGNGVYDVTVQVSDGNGGIDTQAITVAVTNVTGSSQTGNNSANTLTGTGEDETLNGNGGNDTLRGLAGNDTLLGGTGNDLLDGGSGNDTMAGGEGNDTYEVDSTGDAVTEASGAGTDLVRTILASYMLGANVENLTFTGTGSFTGTGNNLANTMTGGAGNDVLDGAGGSDRLVGGLGDDTYIVSNGGDTVVETANQGIDTVRTTLSSYDLGGNVENLTFIGSGAFEGGGNGLANIITGGGSNDEISGGGGNDTLSGLGGRDDLSGGSGDDQLAGGAGDDELNGDGGNDVLLGDDGNDELDGGTGNDQLNGGSGTDVLIAGAGNDRLEGGTGNDRLTGDAGADTFAFKPGFGTDRITDFDANPANGQDFIELSGLGITAADFAARVTIADIGADTLITIDGDPNQTIRLVGVGNANTITVDDFKFL